MKNNPLFLSFPVVEGNLRLFYNVFYDLKAMTSDVDAGEPVDELVLLLFFPKTVKQLCHELNISRQATHQRLKKINSLGWLEIKNSTTDGRQQAYCLNDKGRAVAERVMARAVKKLTAAYQQAGGEAVAGFVKVIESLYNQANKKNHG
ncbi:MAG: helix-turn-helix domain-containing protein [Hydrotalea sp.]|nr:helix-turn-helix domain-containing protein [Hydrotalea sp.]